MLIAASVICAETDEEAQTLAEWLERPEADLEPDTAAQRAKENDDREGRS